MHLGQPGFAYNAGGSFINNKERIKKLKETGDSRYIYQIKLHKACFQHDLSYGDFKDLSSRAASDEILRDKAFNIPKNSKYHGYQRGISSIVYKNYDENLARHASKCAATHTGTGTNSGAGSDNQQLGEELHK